MEVEEIERQHHQHQHHHQQQTPSKFSRVGNNGNNTTKFGHRYGENNNQEENGLDLTKRPNYSNVLPGGNGGNDGNNINSIANNSNHLGGWHHSSRIIRVSRASGGKDRHSKVWTSRGLRDRRVRLSVTTAIQFYDLQDRLGYDQPSKAVEWLIKAAADSIAELPVLNGSFPMETSPNHQLSDDQKSREQLEAPLDSGEADVENFEQEETTQQGQQQLGPLSKSACRSTSETSKVSGLHHLRGDTRVNRVKARERARERTAKEKEKESDPNVHQHQHQNVSHVSQNSTFTELLTAGISTSNHNRGNGGSGSPNAGSSEATLFHRAAATAAAARQWQLTPMDYFGGSGMLGGTPTTVGRAGFPGQVQVGNSLPQGMTMSMLVPQQPTPFSISIGVDNNNSHQQQQHHHHQLEQLQHFPFVPDLILPVTAMAGSGGGGGQGGDYNLNFTISSSSGLAAGFNRGTLQSNSTSSTSPQHSLLTHLQKFSTASMDGSTNNVPCFIGTTATTTTAMEHHHHQFPPGLQLLYGDGRHSDHKGKGKS